MAIRAPDGANKGELPFLRERKSERQFADCSANKCCYLGQSNLSLVQVQRVQQLKRETGQYKQHELLSDLDHGTRNNIKKQFCISTIIKSEVLTSEHSV